MSLQYTSQVKRYRTGESVSVRAAPPWRKGNIHWQRQLPHPMSDRPRRPARGIQIIPTNTTCRKYCVCSFKHIFGFATVVEFLWVFNPRAGGVIWRELESYTRCRSMICCTGCSRRSIGTGCSRRAKGLSKRGMQQCILRHPAYTEGSPAPQGVPASTNQGESCPQSCA